MSNIAQLITQTFFIVKLVLVFYKILYSTLLGKVRILLQYLNQYISQTPKQLNFTLSITCNVSTTTQKFFRTLAFVFWFLVFRQYAASIYGFVRQLVSQFRPKKFVCPFVGLHCGCVPPPCECMCVCLLGYIVGASPALCVHSIGNTSYPPAITS